MSKQLPFSFNTLEGHDILWKQLFFYICKLPTKELNPYRPTAQIHESEQKKVQRNKPMALIDLRYRDHIAVSRICSIFDMDFRLPRTSCIGLSISTIHTKVPCSYHPLHRSANRSQSEMPTPLDEKTKFPQTGLKSC